MRTAFSLFASLLAFGSMTKAEADTLRIAGINPGETVVVSLKGRTSGHCAVQIFHATAETELANFVPSASCKSEIAVFSRRHAMVHEKQVTWTHAEGDVHTVVLHPVIRARVTVWSESRAGRERATLDIERARELYLGNSVGVVFVADYRRLPPGLRETIIADRCEAVEVIKQNRAYIARRLNVYYIDHDFSSRNCAISQTPPDCPSAPGFPVRDGNVTFIGVNATRTALAHEFGHAFGLRPSACGGHTNGIPGFGPDNIMWAGGGEERVHFTLGQVFRMNTQVDQWGGTMLIRNGLRSGGRRCPPNLTNAVCPPLRADWPQ
ncbi:MAG: hypothetical protein IT529_08115 [Burkholderiales bacterium]|nr:hypothetical protein [Burkholderiales bacterium]